MGDKKSDKTKKAKTKVSVKSDPILTITRG